MDAVADAKRHDRRMWAAGDYARIADLLLDVGARIVSTVGVAAGDTVLDVGCGTGNAALPAARAGALVTALDLTPELLEHGRRAAEAEGLAIDWVQGDAEAMPFPDGHFDVVLSTFGAMHAPRHRLAARELARVLRPVGRLGLCNWTPEGMLGDVLRTVGAFLPPPPDFFVPPTLWGTEPYVRDLLEGCGLALQFHREVVDLGFASSEEAADTYIASFGPAVLAHELVERDGRGPALRAALTATFERRRAEQDEALAYPGEYLVVLGRKAS
jgi:SAM-dependent methyltransferase